MEEYTKEETLDLINANGGVFPQAINGDTVKQYDYWFIMKNDRWEHHETGKEE